MHKQKNFFLLIILMALIQISSYAQETFRNAITTIIDNTELNNSSVGLSIIDVKSGNPVLEIDGNKLLTPASTAKLLTTFTAYDLLGPQKKFKTSIGYTGSISEGGILKGDIIIIGGGDPTLGSDRNNPNGNYKELIQQIEKILNDHKITCIDGDLIMEISNMADANIPPKWPWEDLGNYYGSGAWPININENILRITFEGNSNNHQLTKIKKIDPYLPYVSYNNQVKTSTSKGRDEAYIFGGPYQYMREIRGTIPTTSKEFTIKGSLPNPPYDLGAMIEAQLPKLFPNSEIKISRSKISEFKLLKEYYSLPIDQLITEANHKSINIYCDAILRLMSQYYKGDGSIENGLSIINDQLNNLKLSDNELSLKDGSGLSPSNLISPTLMAQFIRSSILKHPDLINTLPQVGKEGTVRSLLKNNEVAPMFRLKSGSMDRVMAYTGIITKDKKQYSIALIVNNFTLEHRIIKKNIEKILETITFHL